VSRSAVTGLKVDIDRIRADNLRKVDVQRKSGLIIRTGCARAPPRPRCFPSGVVMTAEPASS